MSEKKATIDIRACSCVSKFQDARYGQGLRVHNLSQGGKKNNATCTSCGLKKVK